MKGLLHLLETAPRRDRQIMAVAMGGSAVLLALGITLLLMAW
jgi:hypothetical protein